MAGRRINNPDYRWYVVVTTKDYRGRPTYKILSGWEYESDAKDALKDTPEVHGGGYATYWHLRTLRSRGCDPNDNANWGDFDEFEDDIKDLWDEAVERAKKAPPRTTRVTPPKPVVMGATPFVVQMDISQLRSKGEMLDIAEGLGAVSVAVDESKSMTTADMYFETPEDAASAMRGMKQFGVHRPNPGKCQCYRDNGRPSRSKIPEATIIALAHKLYKQKGVDFTLNELADEIYKATGERITGGAIWQRFTKDELLERMTGGKYCPHCKRPY